MHLYLLLVSALATVLPSLGTQAADIAAGQAKAREVCQTCHGMDGLSKIPNAPNIAGHPEIYFSAQLEAYRSEARVNEMMNVVAKELTDEDIANLTAYYTALEVTVKVPAIR